MQAERSGGQMMAGKSPGGGEMGRMQQETRRAVAGDGGGQCSGGGWRAKREVFNQPLTTFPCVAMVLRFYVSVMCSYEPFWRRLGSISAPGGLGGGGGSW